MLFRLSCGKCYCSVNRASKGEEQWMGLSGRITRTKEVVNDKKLSNKENPRLELETKLLLRPWYNRQTSDYESFAIFRPCLWGRLIRCHACSIVFANPDSGDDTWIALVFLSNTSPSAKRSQSKGLEAVDVRRERCLQMFQSREIRMIDWLQPGLATTAA